MATVISNDNISEYNVNKYNFKVLSQGTVGEESALVDQEPQFTQDENPRVRKSDVDSTSLSQNSKDSLIESLMKKTEDMSSNFIKLQMKLESKEEEYEQEIKKVKEDAFAEGIEAGRGQIEAQEKANTDSGREQFSASVATLEKSASEFKIALENIKNSLIDAAVDIAKEVVDVELSDNSNEVASVLSTELIKELQSASKVKLKVNPADHGFISEKVGELEHITVVSDSAVSRGGVIAISDAGNIDSQITKRFERVKKAALNE